MGDDYEPCIQAEFLDIDTGDPLDFTGATGTCEIRGAPGGALLLSPTVTFPSPSGGTVTWSATDTLTAALQPRKAVLSLWITWADGKITTLLESRVTIRLRGGT